MEARQVHALEGGPAGLRPRGELQFEPAAVRWQNSLFSERC